MVGYRKGMVCALLLNVVASRAQATKRAYRSVKRLTIRACHRPFVWAGPGRAGPVRSENSDGPGRDF